MKISVVKALNARTAPSTDAECPSYKNPGDILDVDKVVAGTLIEGNCLWYHCAADGCFYWSGGTATTDELIALRPTEDLYRAEELLELYLSAANELSVDLAAKIEDFKGSAIGYKNSGGTFSADLALIIYVTAKSSSAAFQVPATLNYRGLTIPTDIRTMNNVQLQDLPKNIPPDDGPEYLMGGSISEIVNGKQPSVGTRSVLVTKKVGGADRIYLLTCYHVACGSLLEGGQRDLNCADILVAMPSDKVSPDFKKLPPAKVAAGGFGLSYDYALIAVDASEFNNNIPDFPFAGYYTLAQIKNHFLSQKKLLKYGIRTLETTGQYRAYHAESKDLGCGVVMSGLIETSCMSDKGDSGAPVIDPENNFLVGYIVAGVTVGTDLEKCSFILPYAQLEFNFSIKPYIDLS